MGNLSFSLSAFLFLFGVLTLLCGIFWGNLLQAIENHSTREIHRQTRLQLISHAKSLVLHNLSNQGAACLEQLLKRTEIPREFLILALRELVSEGEISEHLELDAGEWFYSPFTSLLLENEAKSANLSQLIQWTPRSLHKLYRESQEQDLVLRSYAHQNQLQQLLYLAIIIAFLWIPISWTFLSWGGSDLLRIFCLAGLVAGPLLTVASGKFALLRLKELRMIRNNIRHYQLKEVKKDLLAGLLREIH